MTQGLKHTVLVVDDDASVRRALGQWVQRLGYDAYVADGAEAALSILDATPVDVALCDVVMPGMNGIWLADRIRERFPSVAIVMATGLRHLDRSVTLRPGVVAYVVKPFGPDEIATAIKQGLAWRETRLGTAMRAAEGEGTTGKGFLGDPLFGGRSRR
jgi:two-component system OmpR family response regulator